MNNRNGNLFIEEIPIPKTLQDFQEAFQRTERQALIVGADSSFVIFDNDGKGYPATLKAEVVAWSATQSWQIPMRVCIVEEKKSKANKKSQLKGTSQKGLPDKDCLQ